MDRGVRVLKSCILLFSIFIVVLVRATYRDKTLDKYIKTSTKESKNSFKILKIQRR